MNQRIKELMLEAGYAAPELAGRANKLVDLIVKECCQKLEDEGCVEIAIELKQHLGVE